MSTTPNQSMNDDLKHAMQDLYPILAEAIADQYAAYLVSHEDEYSRPPFPHEHRRVWFVHKIGRLRLLPTLLIYLRQVYSINLTEKQQRRVKDVLFATTCPIEVLKQAADNILAPLDITDPCTHADSRLVANLLFEVQAITGSH